MSSDEVWKARLARERAARQEAERLLETKARELYLRNRDLAEATATLEARVAARTADLEAALVAADAASRARLAFLAMVSHELRTPLNAIIGGLGLVGDGTLDAAQRGHVAMMGGSAQALLRIIDDILDLARSESGGFAVEARPFDAPALFAEAVGTFQAPAAAKGLTLTLDVAGVTPGWVESDAGRIRQLVVALLDNAVKFTPAGGVRVTARHADATLEIEVADTGPGLSAADRGRLFEPFVRAERAGRDQHSGTGLGLAICRRIAEALGGSIEAAEAPGAGAVFRVRIPVRAAAPPAHCPAPAEAPPGRLLVVDDLPTNGIVAAGHLRRAGHAVDVVLGGAEALAAHRAAPYDLVLMDLLMPDMDGIETTQALRALDGPQPVILGLTATGLGEVSGPCRAAGMQDVLAKPIAGPALRDAVARWLGSRATTG